MKRFYIDWTEKKNRNEYRYRTWINANNKREVKNILQREQEYRKHNDLPHMFRIVSGILSPNESAIYSTLFILRSN